MNENPTYGQSILFPDYGLLRSCMAVLVKKLGGRVSITQEDLNEIVGTALLEGHDATEIRLKTVTVAEASRILVPGSKLS